MNYTTGSITSTLNCEVVPDTAIHPTCNSLPPICETMRKTNDVLIGCNALANRLNNLLANGPEEKPAAKDRPIESVQQASMFNVDLAVEVMHKLEMALNVLGG